MHVGGKHGRQHRDENEAQHHEPIEEAVHRDRGDRRPNVTLGVSRVIAYARASSPARAGTTFVIMNPIAVGRHSTPNGKLARRGRDRSPAPGPDRKHRGRRHRRCGPQEQVRASQRAPHFAEVYSGESPPQQCDASAQCLRHRANRFSSALYRRIAVSTAATRMPRDPAGLQLRQRVRRGRGDCREHVAQRTRACERGFSAIE